MKPRKYRHVPVSCRYTPEIIRTLNRFAEVTESSASDVLRKALDSFLRREVAKLR